MSPAVASTVTNTPAEKIVEVEFKECVRIGGTVFNGPTETKHADGSMTRYPADVAGVPESLAKIIEEKHWGVVKRRDGIPVTLGTDKDPWMDGKQLGMPQLMARLLELEQENAQLKGLPPAGKSR